MQLQISMAGTYQLINSALAAAAVQILYRQKYIRDVIQAGLQKTFWPGRMEKIRDHVYIDGAHNEAGIRALTDTLTRRFRDEAIYLLFAVAEDKDYTTMIKTLCSMEGLAGVVVTSLDNERRTDIETVAGLFEKNGHASVIRSYNIKEAFDAAQAAAGTHVLCCCGSLYLAGSIKALN